MGIFSNRWTHLSFLILLSSLLSADELQSRLSALETRMAAIKTRTEKGTIGGKMAPARPVIDGYGFFVKGDLLCWHLQETGSDYVIKSKEPTVNSVKGHARHAHFGWDGGFRIGAGYLFEHDGWDSQICFTWFQTDAHEKTVASSEGLLFAQIATPVDPTTKAKIHWDIGYYTFDLELARSFFLSKWFAVRSACGMQTAWIDQHVHFRERFIPGANHSHLKMKGRNDFFGIGPLFGIDTTWYFDSHFSLLTHFRGALLAGKFEVTDREKFSGLNPSKLTNIKGGFRAIVPNVNMQLMAQWEQNFNENANHFTIQLGYEFQYWWNQNQLLDIQSDTFPIYERKLGGLSINGITLQLRLDF